MQIEMEGRRSRNGEEGSLRHERREEERRGTGVVVGGGRACICHDVYPRVEGLRFEKGERRDHEPRAWRGGRERWRDGDGEIWKEWR
jgi:hypothetical protein